MVVLQLLPLFGLGGCSAIWATVPVGSFLLLADRLQFWLFVIAAYGCALLSLCWGLGYLVAARRERLGCGALLVGPTVTAILYLYVFEGYRLSNTDADERRRLAAMVWTLAIVGPFALLMAWDAWRLTRPRGAEPG